MQRRQHNSFATLAVFPLSASLVGKFKPTSFKSCQFDHVPLSELSSTAICCTANTFNDFFPCLSMEHQFQDHMIRHAMRLPCRRIWVNSKMSIKMPRHGHRRHFN